MGYYTKYSASFTPQTNEVVQHIEQWKRSDDYDEGTFYNAWVDQTDRTKWYDHDDFMKKLSKQFPNVVFILEGEGEGPEDIWKKYYKDGKVQVARAKITFDKYDEGKLK